MIRLFILGGYKGYGLVMMVEVFCGIFSGVNFGFNICIWKDFEKVVNFVSEIYCIKFLIDVYN